MEKLDKKTKNKYVVSIHEDVAALYETVKARAKHLGLEHLAHVDVILCGKLFEYLQNEKELKLAAETENFMKNNPAWMQQYVTEKN